MQQSIAVCSTVLQYAVVKGKYVLLYSSIYYCAAVFSVCSSI